jgi:hypothetical protein
VDRESLGPHAANYRARAAVPGPGAPGTASADGYFLTTGGQVPKFVPLPGT